MPKSLDWQPGDMKPSAEGIFRRRDSQGRGTERAYWDGEVWHAVSTKGRVFSAAHHEQSRPWAAASVRVVEELQAGARFGMLTFLKDIGSDQKSHRWLALFRCDCGNEKAMNLYEVRTGRITACGCRRHSEESLASASRKMRAWHRENADQVLQTNRRISAAQAGTERAMGPTAAWSMNVRAKHWALIAPNGDRIEGWNLYELVRLHADRFQATDLVWKDGMCNATKRLSQLFQQGNGKRIMRSWKGWRVDSGARQEWEREA